MRVYKTFTCEGHHFQEGTFVTLESDLVRAIVSEYPGYFQAASMIAPPS